MSEASNLTKQRLRWTAVDDDGPQDALFTAPEQRVTHPEFAGLEFVHVRAKSLINEVPDAAHLPFRYTINAYRGCSHACTYCLSPETPILLADGCTTPLAEIRVGDLVYGTVRRGNYRRYVTTRVLDRWSTVKPAFRVTLEDGTRLIASGDHRFLSNRGWKHVTGAEQGRRRRPHLTLNNELMGTGGFVSPPDHGTDYRRGYLCGMIRGDAHIGSYSYDRPGRTHGAVHRFRLALSDTEPLTRTRNFLLNRDIATDEFLFAEATSNTRKMTAIRNYSREGVAAVRDLVEWPGTPSPQWRKGFLAGIFDAEGSYSRGILRIANSDEVIIRYVAASLNEFGFSSVVEPPKLNGCRTVRVPGGLREHLRFFHTVDPAVTRKRRIPEGYALKSDADLQVTAVEPLGMEIPMCDITTGTGDFIANGVVSHNCFARPTHEYLNLNAGEDFERVIVVKINAVDVLRRELRRGRTGGEHVAMGTNTDPYQRAEGRYRLTRGVIQTLTEAGNPFSILTKSPLVLRDLDLLREANRRTDVAVNFSVGTLDTDAWKTSEPGTPHPAKRIEAVARLREAGIRSGVMVAPVLPGISDSREQLEDVVTAALEAGAVTVTPILLHLRPGVKEQFMPWLEENYPALSNRYQRLYPRSYAPKPQRRRVARIVDALVDEHAARDRHVSRREATRDRTGRRDASDDGCDRRSGTAGGTDQLQLDL